MNKWNFLALAAISSPAFAHEGHGVDVNSILHYLSAPHIALPLGMLVLACGATFIAKKLNRKR